MNSGATGSKRWILIGGVAFTLIAVAAVGGVMAVQAKRAEYVRQTIDVLPAADREYTEGRFAEAVATAAAAEARRQVNPTWFKPADEKKIREGAEFYAAKLALWKKVEEASAIAEPAARRAALQALLGSGARPIEERLGPQYLAALKAEREQVQAGALARIPSARTAYVEGSWDSFIKTLEEIRGAVQVLPELTRGEAAHALAEGLKEFEASEASVSEMKAICGGKDDGFVKADRLRALIGKLADRKANDKSLHRDLRKAIAEADPETRKPVAGTKLARAKHRELTDKFKSGTELEVVGDPDDTTVIELEGPAHRYAIRIAGKPAQFLIEVDRVRINFPLALVANRESRSLKRAEELSRALRASRHARVFADEAWIVAGDAPDLCAFNLNDKTACVMLGGRLFEGTVAPGPDVPALVNAFLTAARELEQAVRGDAGIPAEVKGPMTALLKAAHTRAPPADYLDGQFCREAVHDGYVEKHLPRVSDAVAAKLKEYRKNYDEVIRWRPRFEAKSSDGATVTLLINYEDDAVWRVIDGKTTTFSMIPRDHMGSSIAAVSVFEGSHEVFPSDLEPVEVRMHHGVVGTVSKSGSGGTLTSSCWNEALTLGAIPEHYGTGEWQVPPHALKVDARGQARELILPRGSIKVGMFDSITDAANRRKTQEEFLKRCAQVFHDPGEFHLFYRYFVQYVLDSPVTTATTLIGSSRHCGDAHQDASQTLDRRLNGKFLADCDDLAELYWTILRKQDRPAFVLGVPGHATCGVAEKDKDGWTFFCVDTGPARQLKGPDLDAVVEKLLRTYDRDGSMSFDPRQMRFLFRFGGEQTRSDYYLDSRILRDPAYSDLMIQVQEYWHFGFYALGIETMSRVLETDKMPANCQEIAGLYTRVGLWPDALKWTQAGIDALDAKDQFTGLQDTMRVVQCLRELKRKDEAATALKKTAERVLEVVRDDPSQADRYRGLKFNLAAQMATNGLPWDGWALIREEAVMLVKSGRAAESLMLMVIQVLQKMNDAHRGGAELTGRQKEVMGEIDDLLDSYFKTSCFDSEDSSMDVARKYGQYFGYQVAVHGLEKATAELLKPEFPKDRRRPDIQRDSKALLAWPWVRLSPVAYLVAAGSALDKEQPGAGGTKVAIEVIRSLETVLPEIRTQGSLGTLEFQVLDLRLLRGCFEMDEKAIRGVFDEMKRQGWGALYESLSGTLGRAAEHMKVEDFEKVFRIFCEYNVPRRHYYGVVYAASAVEARGHALAASKICIEKFPQDADMKREHALLQKLAK